MPQRWKPTSTFTSTSTLCPAAFIRADHSRATAGSIDDEREARLLEQAKDPFSVDRIDRVGKTDVGDAVGGEDLRLADLGAADADRAARDLDAGDGRRLVRFRVRPEAKPPRVGGRLHAIDVAVES